MSKKKKPVTSALRVRGSPHHLATVVPGLQNAPQHLTFELPTPPPRASGQGKPSPQELAAFPAFLQRTGVLRIDLPRDTLPGTYEGRIRIGDREQPVTVEVEPRVHLRLFPKRLYLSGSPGEHLGVDLTLTNQGNAPAEIRRAYACGLFDIDGFDRILGRILNRELKREPLEELIDEVGREHAGLMRIKIARGSGEVQPGEVREIRLELVLPAQLHPSRTYNGMWRLHNLHYPMRVTGTGELPPARRPLP
ncbi:MAG TPA: hypothetical protein VF179_24125 [Thermoanaerobaculia bacterium]|nr:hypothetical protein [Thermoanaerobaculia bacterium]